MIFLDTETTGLDPERHRIIELAFKVQSIPSGKFEASYETVVRQPLEVWAENDPESLKINGFTWEETLGGKSERVVESEIIEMFNRMGVKRGTSLFCCQNPSFDRAFFSQIVPLEIQEGFKWPYHWLDLASMYWAIKTMGGVEAIAQIEKEGVSKNKIAENYGLPPEAYPHRAMNGVNHLIECYSAICKLPSQVNTLEKN